MLNLVVIALNEFNASVFSERKQKNILQVTHSSNHKIKNIKPINLLLYSKWN